jgi:hypothetical protein
MSAKRGRQLRTAKVEEAKSVEGKLLKSYLPYE